MQREPLAKRSGARRIHFFFVTRRVHLGLRLTLALPAAAAAAATAAAAAAAACRRCCWFTACAAPDTHTHARRASQRAQRAELLEDAGAGGEQALVPPDALVERGVHLHRGLAAHLPSVLHPRDLAAHHQRLARRRRLLERHLRRRVGGRGSEGQRGSQTRCAAQNGPLPASLRSPRSGPTPALSQPRPRHPPRRRSPQPSAPASRR